MGRAWAATWILGALLWASAASAAAFEVPPLRDLAGHPASLAQYRGRMLLLNFWATWCKPCRQEMPALNRLYGEVDARRVAIIGIAADDPVPVRAFVTRLGIRYPILGGDSDALFAWSAALGNDSAGLPFTALLDASGKVLWIKSGGVLTAPQVRSAIRGARNAAARP
jgi:thiol-disulfide isomerase/thioredoxin